MLYLILHSYTYSWITVVSEAAVLYNMSLGKLAVSEELYVARSAYMSSTLILIDLSSTFDTVNHQIFLTTLFNIPLVFHRALP